MNVKGGQLRRMYIEEDYQSQLNKLGDDGWELVGIIHFTEAYGRLCKIHFILKKLNKWSVYCQLFILV